jgi:hypothetical protein
MFLVIYVISPAVIELWEAILTLLWYPIMVGAVWIAEFWGKEDKICLKPGCTIASHHKHYHDGQNKEMLRFMLRAKADTHGAYHVIEMATG